MRFVTFLQGSRVAPGLMIGEDKILDLELGFVLGASQGLIKTVPNMSLPLTMQAIISAGPAALEGVKILAKHAGDLKAAIVPFASVTLMAPIPRPLKNVFCIGRNYAEHVHEGSRAQGVKLDLPEHPQYFTKPPTAVIGPGAAIPLDPEVTGKLDYEVELAVIIGTTGRNIPKEKALSHIFGYTVLNDVTGRDLQRRHGQWFKGKGLDASCPMGPWILHASELPDPQHLAISITVNGEVRQNANTSDMIFDIATMISVLSSGLTLEPGDIIATGTPSGVGYAMEPPQYLKPGDTMTCTVEKVGSLTNHIVAA